MLQAACLSRAACRSVASSCCTKTSAKFRRYTETTKTKDRIIKTKIVCTIGPASDSPDVLNRMIEEGMDCARLNFSHGTHKYNKEVFQRVRDISAKHDNQVSILCDLQGPKIRLGKMFEPFNLKTGDKVRVTPESVLGTPSRIPIVYPSILKDLNVGDRIFINDGIVQLSVKRKEDQDLVCNVEAGGLISNHKGCNIPSGNLSVDVLSEKDIEDIRLIAQLDPEYVAASFIGTARDVTRVRECLAAHGNKKVKIVTKIERPLALKNIDEIIEVSDALMVARGDLGVEIPPPEVPIAQKEIVRKCNREGRPVIIATQMLESMTAQPRPTRAEANDVFNAVLDGADAVMLSGETSIGKYPIEAVRFMDDIVAAAEQSAYMAPRRFSEGPAKNRSYERTIGYACFNLVKEFKEIGYKGKVLVITASGYTARMISKYRPDVPIVALSPNMRTVRELTLVWGVRSHHNPVSLGNDLEMRSINALRKVMSMGFLEQDDHVIIVLSSMVDNDCGAYIGVYDIKRLMHDLEKGIVNDLFTNKPDQK